MPYAHLLELRLSHVQAEDFDMVMAGEVRGKRPPGAVTQEGFFKPKEPLIAPPSDLGERPSDRDMAWAELASGFGSQGKINKINKTNIVGIFAAF